MPCDYLLVSDYPGKTEAIKGKPLLGKTGDEVNRYLDGHHLPDRSEMRLVNLIRYWSPENVYTGEDVVRDEGALIEEIEHVEPKVIVTLGRWSARWFLGDVAMDEVQGIPWYWPDWRYREIHGDVVEEPVAVSEVHHERQQDDGAVREHAQRRPVIFPIYNPAAGFRSPEVQSFVAHGFHELANFLAGKVEPRELFLDPFPNPLYQLVPDDKAWIRAALLGVTSLAIDSEGHPDRVWSIQFCVNPGTAYVIRFDQKEALRAFFEWLVATKPLVEYHGSLHDFGIMRVVLQRLKIDIERLYDIPFDDTQIMAYLLQLEPIGLKPNCVRHCNMVMQDYNDVMGDAQTLLAQDYLVKVFDVEQRAYKARQQAEFEAINRTPLIGKDGKPKRNKAGQIRYRHTRVLPKLPMSDLHKAVKRVLNSVRPYDLWQDQREDIKVAAYNVEVA